MTTSYVKEAINELKAQKKINKANEEIERVAKEKLLAERKKLSDERIAKKQAAIDAGEVFVNEVSVVTEIKKVKAKVKVAEEAVEEVIEKPKAVKKTLPKKTTVKKSKK
jgi:predicted methyltransferase